MKNLVLVQQQVIPVEQMSNQNISTKLCIYGCGQNLFWNTATNEYWELFTKKKHICTNRTTNNNVNKSSTYVPKPNYYNKFTKQPKPKMSNSLELLSGPISKVQRKYEILSDIVTEYNGKVHGSQSNVNGNSISLVVYYEVPEGKREEVKQRFNTITKDNIISQR